MKSLPKVVLASKIMLGGIQAHAVTLPPGYAVQQPSPTVSVTVRTGGTPQGGVATVNDPQSTTVHAPGAASISAPSSAGAAVPGSATADGSILYGPSPSISAQALAQHTAVTLAGIRQAVGGTYWGYNDAGAGVQLYYFLAISGPTPTVNVNVSAVLDASSSANISYGSGTATFFVQKQDSGGYVVNDKVFFDSTLPFASVNASGDNVTGYHGQYNENGVYSFATGSVYVIGLTARATATDYGSLTAATGIEQTRADVDPMLTVAAGVADAGSYRFILSAGIGNSIALTVPEPPEWALLLAGCGWLAVRTRRQPPAHS